MAEPPTARQQAFYDALAELVNAYVDVTGPAETADDVPNAALAEWVLVTGWVDLDSGDTYITKGCLPGMPSHHQLGLLRSWLVELER